MDYMLDPPEPSKYEQWVDDRVEVLLEEISLALDAKSMIEQGFILSDYVAWDKLSEDLQDFVEQELVERKTESAIEQWEDRQSWKDM